jgi:hypothetical protein
MFKQLTLHKAVVTYACSAWEFVTFPSNETATPGKQGSLLHGKISKQDTDLWYAYGFSNSIGVQ